MWVRLPLLSYPNEVTARGRSSTPVDLKTVRSVVMCQVVPPSGDLLNISLYLFVSRVQPGRPTDQPVGALGPEGAHHLSDGKAFGAASELSATGLISSQDRCGIKIGWEPRQAPPRCHLSESLL